MSASSSSGVLRYDPRKEGLARWLGSLETDIMCAVWDCDRAITVKRIYRELLDDREIAYTSVMTTMERLVKKGLMTRERVGLRYEYTPVDADGWAFIERQELAVAQSLVTVEYRIKPL